MSGRHVQPAKSLIGCLLPQSKCRRAILVQDAPGLQPVPSVLCIAMEPGPGVAKAKTVTPCIHIAHYPLATHTLELICQHNLQIADRRLFEVVAARVTVEIISSLSGHTDRMTHFMQQRMHGSILASVNRMPFDTGLAVTPETPGNCFISAEHYQPQAKSFDKQLD
jgi:hypothetical protein